MGSAVSSMDVRLTGVSFPGIIMDAFSLLLLSGLIFWRFRAPDPDITDEQDTQVLNGTTVDPKRAAHTGSYPLTFQRSGFVNADPRVQEIYEKLQ